MIWLACGSDRLKIGSNLVLDEGKISGFVGFCVKELCGGVHGVFGGFR